MTRLIERWLVPVATKLNAQRHVGAVRDAFMLTFPLTLSASMVILLNNLVFSEEGIIARILMLPKLFPNLESAQQLLSPVANGTISVMSLFIAFLVAHILATHFKADALLAGLTSIACFLILYPSPIFNEDLDLMMMETTFLGAQGLFVAMLVGVFVGEFLPKLFKSKRLIIKMPEMVPPAVARSFSALFPIMIMIMTCSLISAGLGAIAPGGINELIYTGLQAPLRQMGANVVGVVVIVFLETLLWGVGIHGPNTLAVVKTAIFAETDLANLTYINAEGTILGIPYPDNFANLYGPFANMGGSGMTLGLIIAIFIASKRKEQRDIAKMSFAPGLFNINEPIIFGLPIVLNPILIIPFVTVPVINIIIGYLAVIVFKIIPAPALELPWTMPGPLVAFFGTGGNFVALGVGILCLVVSVLVYLPFVIAGNKVKTSE